MARTKQTRQSLRRVVIYSASSDQLLEYATSMVFEVVAMSGLSEELLPKNNDGHHELECSSGSFALREILHNRQVVSDYDDRAAMFAASAA